MGSYAKTPYQDQQYRASGLNLVVAAIILWNTVYLAAAVEQLKRDGAIVNDDHLQHLSRSDGNTSISLETFSGIPETNPSERTTPSSSGQWAAITHQFLAYIFPAVI